MSKLNAKQVEKAQAKNKEYNLSDGAGLFLRVHSTDSMSAEWAKRHENRWRLHLKKSLGHLLAKDLTRFHLTAVLEKMAVSGIKEETRKALTTLNLMLDYGLKHHIKENPARMLKPK